jgi:c-di-GMP-binding flagellar brake protein YcgR
MVKKEEETKPCFGTVNFERRKHPRFSCDLPVEYWHMNESKNIPGRAVNISEAGLLLFICEEIEIGQNLRLKLFFSGFKFKSIEAQVQVVWKDFQFGKGEDYRTGLKFINISLEDMDKLKNFLNYLKNIQNPTELNIPQKILRSCPPGTCGIHKRRKK